MSPLWFHVTPSLTLNPKPLTLPLLGHPHPAPSSPPTPMPAEDGYKVATDSAVSTLGKVLKIHGDVVDSNAVAPPPSPVPPPLPAPAQRLAMRMRNLLKIPLGSPPPSALPAFHALSSTIKQRMTTRWPPTTPSQHSARSWNFTATWWTAMRLLACGWRHCPSQPTTSRLRRSMSCWCGCWRQGTRACWGR